MKDLLKMLSVAERRERDLLRDAQQACTSLCSMDLRECEWYWSLGGLLASNAVEIQSRLDRAALAVLLWLTYKEPFEVTTSDRFIVLVKK